MESHVTAKKLKTLLLTIIADIYHLHSFVTITWSASSIEEKRNYKYEKTRLCHQCKQHLWFNASKQCASAVKSASN